MVSLHPEDSPQPAPGSFKKNSALFILAAVLPFLCGCAKAVGPEDAARLKGGKVIAVTYAAPPFAVERGGYSEALYQMFGFGSWTESVREGRRWTEEYALADPSIKAAGVFLSALKKGLGVEAASFQELGDDSPGALRKTFGAKGIVFDMKTRRWMLTYFPADARRYRLTFEARGRFISLEGPEIIWKAGCRYTEGDIRRSNTLAEFEANHAALLREKLNEAAESCAKELREEFFGKGDQGP